MKAQGSASKEIREANRIMVGKLIPPYWLLIRKSFTDLQFQMYQRKIVSMSLMFFGNCAKERKARVHVTPLCLKFSELRNNS